MSVTYMDVICLGVLVADIFASPMPALLSAFATAYGRPSLLDWILFEKPKSVFHLHMTIASPTSLR